MTKHRAVVLLSGGIDSATTLAVARADMNEITALSFDYGQRHAIELKAAHKVAQSLGVSDHVIVRIDLRQFGQSALTDAIDVPKRRPTREIESGIPVTYVPARNTIFLAYALALAEVRQAAKIYFGANIIDYSGYPDCRPGFIRAFEELANLATKSGAEGKRLTIEAPLIHMTKSEIIKLGTDLRLDYSLTWSCYDPINGSLACGECDSCIIRHKGFQESGINDPTPYVKSVKV
jgi:7-cyano-7-deazaguanine synthase